MNSPTVSIASSTSTTSYDYQPSPVLSPRVSVVDASNNIFPNEPAANQSEHKSLWQRSTYCLSVAVHHVKLAAIATTATLAAVGAGAGAFAGCVVTSLAAVPVSLTIKLAECCGIAKKGTALKFQIGAGIVGGLAGGAIGFAAGGITGAAISVVTTPIPFTVGLVRGAVDASKGDYGRVDRFNQTVDDACKAYKETSTYISKMFIEELLKSETTAIEKHRAELRALQERDVVYVTDVFKALNAK